MISLVDITFAQLLEALSLIVSPTVAVSMYIARNDNNVCMFLLVLLLVSFADEHLSLIAESWGTWYYAYGAFANLVIITAILARKYIANYFAEGYVTSESNFFKKALKGYAFKLQEGGIIGLCAISILLCLIAIAESWLYIGYVIDNLYFREYVFGTAQAILHILTAFAALVLSLNAKK